MKAAASVIMFSLSTLWPSLIYAGRGRRGKADNRCSLRCGMGFGNPLVPDVWKTCEMRGGAEETDSGYVKVLDVSGFKSDKGGSSIELKVDWGVCAPSARLAYFL